MSMDNPYQQQDDHSTLAAYRPVPWGYIVIPILIVLCIIIICSILYAHHRGKRTAKEMAKLEARQGEEKWREATKKEVESLAESAVSQAARFISTTAARQSPPPPPPPKRSQPMPFTAGQYAHLPSELGTYNSARSSLQPLQRALTTLSSSSCCSRESSRSYTSARPFRRGMPYISRRENGWDSDGESSAPLLSRHPTLSQCHLAPIPEALRPRSLNDLTMANPFEGQNDAVQPNDVYLQLNNALQQPYRH
jgi:hypothetical protein